MRENCLWLMGKSANFGHFVILWNPIIDPLKKTRIDSFVPQTKIMTKLSQMTPVYGLPYMPRLESLQNERGISPTSKLLARLHLCHKTIALLFPFVVLRKFRGWNRG